MQRVYTKEKLKIWDNEIKLNTQQKILTQKKNLKKDHRQ